MGTVTSLKEWKQRHPAPSTAPDTIARVERAVEALDEVVASLNGIARTDAEAALVTITEAVRSRRLVEAAEHA
jgi:hypothetical protein